MFPKKIQFSDIHDVYTYISIDEIHQQNIIKLSR